MICHDHEPCLTRALRSTIRYGSAADVDSVLTLLDGAVRRLANVGRTGQREISRSARRLSGDARSRSWLRTACSGLCKWLDATWAPV